MVTTSESIRKSGFKCPVCGRDIAPDVMVGETEAKCFKCSSRAEKKLLNAVAPGLVGKRVYEPVEESIVGIDPLGRWAGGPHILALQGVEQTLEKNPRPADVHQTIEEADFETTTPEYKKKPGLSDFEKTEKIKAQQGSVRYSDIALGDGAPIQSRLGRRW